MRVDLFDFELPESSIALRPVEPRDAARMLVVRPDAGFDDRIIRDLPELLQPGDVLVLNDTKVIPSRLYGLRVREETAAKVEIMLHKRESADRWRAFARPAKSSPSAIASASAKRRRARRANWCASTRR